MTKFKELGVNKELCKAIEELGFKKPTEVQKESIPFLLTENEDLIALAQTGTGKTAAFGLPAIQQVDVENKNVQVIILCPTRELCVQICKDLESYFFVHIPYLIMNISKLHKLVFSSDDRFCVFLCSSPFSSWIFL